MKSSEASISAARIAQLAPKMDLFQTVFAPRMDLIWLSNRGLGSHRTCEVVGGEALGHVHRRQDVLHQRVRVEMGALILSVQLLRVQAPRLNESMLPLAKRCLPTPVPCLGDLDYRTVGGDRKLS